jgi:hypothetical protein
MVRQLVLRILALAFIALAVSLPSIAEAAQASRVTIQELKKNWNRYNGKTVQVRGQIDGCGTFDACQICPEDMTNATFDSIKCLLIAFVPDVNRSALDLQTNFLMQEAHRFATVTVIAHFNGTCLGPDVLCNDGPADLNDARVLEIHSRKSAVDGLLGGRPLGRLMPVLLDERAEMLAEFTAVLPLYSGSPSEVFRANLEDDLKDNPDLPNGVVCVCLERSCEGHWPTQLIERINSPANPFHCWMMIKKESGWRVLPGFW